MPALQLVSWNLTRRCNLACGHCYLDAVQRKREAPGELSAEEALGAVGHIAQAAPGAMLVLTGGEPLLRKDLFALVARASALGLMPVIGTNGVLLDQQRAHALKSAGAAGVGISLDSAAPEFHDRLRGRPGAWAAARDGLRAARRAGLAVQVQATLFPQNRHEIAAFAGLAQEHGALALNFFFLVCTGRGVTQTDMPQAMVEEALGEIIALQSARPQMMIRARCAPYARRLLGLRAGEAGEGYESWSSACLAGRSYLRITPQGRVTPCPYIPEVVGDLRREPLAEIWQASPVLGRLRGELPQGRCGDCDFRYSCGGCRARAAAATGNLMAEDPKCTHARLPGAEPERAPAPQSPGAVRWTPEAQSLLERIPAFVRQRVRKRLETKAYAAGLSAITLEFMRANRPAAFGVNVARPSISRPAAPSASSMHAAVEAPPK
jgi:radical SAM protein with 4Fe4S-binding SPASM domain